MNRCHSKMLCELTRQNKNSFKFYGFNLIGVAEILQKPKAALNKEICRTSFTLMAENGAVVKILLKNWKWCDIFSPRSHIDETY